MIEKVAPWEFDEENSDITCNGAPVFKVYREHDFPCIEDEERAAADMEYIAHATVAVMLLNTIATTKEPSVGAAIEAMPLNVLREERTMTEALRRAILAGDNLLAELEAHQESTGELLIEEDQAVVEGAKADLEYARAALESLK